MSGGLGIFRKGISRSVSAFVRQKMGQESTVTGTENQAKVGKKRPLKVSIEGNIGCGKSTLINYFSGFPEVDAQPEPLDKWRDVQGHNLLMLLYTEPRRWNFTFQHYVQLSRLELQTQQSNHKIQIFERSLQNNRHCFMESAYESGLLATPEYIALCEWFDWIEQNMDIGLDLIVYLRSNPLIVHERMQRRGRPEESSVSLDYLTRIHDYYERWLVKCEPETLPAPVLVVDVDNDLSTVKAMYKTIEQYILGRKEIPRSGYIKEFGWAPERIEKIKC